MRVCSYCHLRAISDNAIFCRGCGVLLDDEVPAPMPARRYNDANYFEFDINKIRGPFDFLLDLMLGPVDPEPPLIIYNNSFARCGWCGWAGVLDTCPTVHMVDSQGFRARQCPRCGEIMDSADFRY